MLATSIGFCLVGQKHRQAIRLIDLVVECGLGKQTTQSLWTLPRKAQTSVELNTACRPLISTKETISQFLKFSSGC